MKQIYLAVTNDLITDNRVHKVACTLLKSGAKVTVIGRRFAQDKNTLQRPYHIKRFRLFFNKGPYFYMEYNIRLFLFLFIKRFDIVVANDLDTLLGAYYASKLRCKKLVYDSHEFFTEVPELIDRAFPKKVWQIIEKKILPKIKHCYTVSGPIAASYENLYGISMKVVRNVPLYKERITPKEKGDNGTKHIIYQGSLNIGRGLEQIIEAMLYTENMKLTIVGDGDIQEKLIQQVKENNLTHKVELKGRVPLEKLYNETKNADLGLALEENMGLNYYYALPNKLFDYVQARIPVLISPYPEMQKVVFQYDIGTTYVHKSPYSLAQKFKEIFELKNRYAKWKENTNEAAKELCWEKEEPVLIDIYSQLGLTFK